jgi:hypothetical protein
MKTILTLLLLFSTSVMAQSDPRYCGPPARDDKNRIMRSQDVKIAFQALYACPSTGSHSGACPGWAKDHVIPLACGGCDSVQNLQWLRNQIKSCAGIYCKDRWERKVYCTKSNNPQGKQ